MVYATVVAALWAMLPAYVPNNAAVVFGGGRPVDGGRTMGGRRLLGDGKTWRGTAAGLVTGAVVALALGAVRVRASAALGVDLPRFPPAVVLALPVGAMAGDMAASFLKRRLGTERGAPVLGLDQLDFVVGALAFSAAAAPGWFVATFTVPAVVVVLVATPLLHLLTNAGAYLLGLKPEPW
jgi:CDP-2,3-bis-(O-geranylgeranyl)-sn-glycerol synthase